MQLLTEMFLTKGERLLLRSIRLGFFKRFYFTRKRVPMCLPSPEELPQSGHPRSTNRTS